MGPSAGATGSASLTVGAALASPFFAIASFDVTAAGFCGVCSPLTENLTAVEFDSSTFGVLGHITGTFLGGGGGTHSYDLELTDISGGTGTFTFTDTRQVDGNVVVNSGTYTPLVATADGPSAIVLLALGAGGIAALRRRRQSH